MSNLSVGDRVIIRIFPKGAIWPALAFIIDIIEPDFIKVEVEDSYGAGAFCMREDLIKVTDEEAYLFGILYA